MALFGDLGTFAITDLLQWVEAARKTGVLSVRTGDVTRQVVFADGRLTGCSSDDPSSLLGQSLLARGVIDEAQLREGLSVQRRTGGNLGAILVETGAATSEQVVRAVAAKAEDTVYALFEDETAEFRYRDGAEPPAHMIPTDLRIQDILLRGVQRYDEVRRIREVFPHHGVVLARTERPVPRRVAEGRAAARILRAVDGRRTIAEILLHARASNYLVSKFLYELHRQDLVRIVEIRAAETPAPAAAKVPALEDASAAREPDGAQDLTSELHVAERLIDRSEPDAALAVLHATARAHPGVPSVGEMIVRAENDLACDLRSRVPAHAVPAKARDVSGLDGDTLEPGEAYLLGLLDGRTNVQALAWTVPMREIDVLRALHGLLAKGHAKLVEVS